METKKTSRKTKQERFVNLPVLNPWAESIDIGHTLHGVAVLQEKVLM